MRADLEDARQGLGRVPQGRPPLPGPGEQYWRLKQVHAETVDEARRRAKAMPWGAKVRRGPSLCRGWWMFAGGAVPMGAAIIEAAERLMCLADVNPYSPRGRMWAGLWDDDVPAAVACAAIKQVRAARDADLLASGWSSIVDIEREAAGLLLAGEWRA